MTNTTPGMLPFLPSGLAAQAIGVPVIGSPAVVATVGLSFLQPPHLSLF